MRLVDLTHPIVPYAENPYAQFPTAPRTMVGVTSTFEAVGWFSRAWYLGEHCGTHVDAGIHFNPSGRPVDQIPVDYLYGEAVVLNFAHKAGGEDVTAQEVQAAVRGVEGGLGGARIALIRSDRSKLWARPEYQQDMINMTPEATEWLLQQGVRVVGCDACVWEVDRALRAGPAGRRMRGAERFPSHALMGKYDFLIIENLAHLDRIAAARFTFVGLPLPLVGGSGSPIRAVALVPGAVSRPVARPAPTAPARRGPRRGRSPARPPATGRR